MKIKISDVLWKKHGTYSIIDGVTVENDVKNLCIGTVDDCEIGHYIIGHNENEVCCIVNFTEKDGGSIFINRTYVYDNMEECNDDFFREKIVKVYNKFLEEGSLFKEIFN